ncbi:MULTISPECIES: hypothetical protein [Gordonia]|uniref:Uncharacterized protein n=1 Tax=Gordonia spumicola TaxID=589161 RepID=A0A7I9V4N5_9ACTN|nr:hypothetical protein [Gordonia spumicola]GEE00197.1 hypothetical protein nbrc107696_06430 [Gordonia spumicola]
MMNAEQVRSEVNRIIMASADDEAAHGDEDELLAALVRDYCPADIVTEVQRLADAPFSRWCA